LIDLHSHILPGLDDGAVDMEDAVAIARAAQADGITAIAATPHVREDYPTTADAMEQGVRQLRRILEDRRIDIELLPGGELSLEQLDYLSLDELRRFGLGGNPNYLLVETPYRTWPLPLDTIAGRFEAVGLVPVIAHPERNPVVQGDISKVEGLVQSGALIQITAASIDGRLGSRARACSEKLLDEELVHLISSDAHTAGIREAGLSAAFAAVGDQALADWLTEEVPRAIVMGEEFPWRPRRVKRSRSFFERLLGR
jgi:protein-tyrosine phosphatase